MFSPSHTLTDHCAAALDGEVLELARLEPATPEEAVDILGAVLGLTEPSVDQIVGELLENYNPEGEL